MGTMIPAVPFATALFVAMLIGLEVGRRLGIIRLAKDPDGAMSGLGALEGAIFGLYGLLLAFTFSGAAQRLDTRRQLIAEEAEAISTAYNRIDLLPAEAQPALRVLFRRYVDSRLQTFRNLPDWEAAEKELAESFKIQDDIWAGAVVGVPSKGMPDVYKAMVFPALNQMFDMETTRTMSARIHPPSIIFGLLFLLALLCSLLVGYASAARKQRSWLHFSAFVLINVISVFVILDLEYPRVGFIRVDPYDQVLIEVRNRMH
jgi:hypothetical protein